VTNIKKQIDKSLRNMKSWSEPRAKKRVLLIRIMMKFGRKERVMLSGLNLCPIETVNLLFIHTLLSRSGRLFISLHRKKFQPRLFIFYRTPHGLYKRNSAQKGRDLCLTIVDFALSNLISLHTPAEREIIIYENTSAPQCWKHFEKFCVCMFLLRAFLMYINRPSKRRFFTFDALNRGTILHRVCRTSCCLFYEIAGIFLQAIYKYALVISALCVSPRPKRNLAAGKIDVGSLCAPV
jgi:hypothetical protein